MHINGIIITNLNSKITLSENQVNEFLVQQRQVIKFFLLSSWIEENVFQEMEQLTRFERMIASLAEQTCIENNGKSGFAEKI